MHGEDADLWERDTNAPHGRGFWKGIQQAEHIVELNTDISINNGESIRFWQDIWKGNKSLREQFPKAFKKAKHKNKSEIILNGAWDIHFKNSPSLEQMQDIINPISFLDNPPLLSDCTDEASCRFGDLFSAKECYNWLSIQSNPSPNEAPFSHKDIWVKYVPPKIQFFMWTLIQDAIPTLDNLSRRGCVFSPLVGSVNKKRKLQTIYFSIAHIQSVFGITS